MAPVIVAGGLPIAFSSGDEESAQAIAGAVESTLRLATREWGLAPPKACRLYVMSSWRSFFWQSAPDLWKPVLFLTYPVWAARARRVWPFSAGWTVRFGRRIAIGVKPPRLLEISDKSVGAHMFVQETDPIAKIRHVACHELIHAGSAHLRLPAWLNEGLAAVSVDRFLGKSTVREDSLDLLQRTQPKGAPPSYRAASRLQGETLAYHAVRGYWIVRFLEEAHPGFVRSLLKVRRRPKELDRQLAQRLGLPLADLWRDIDGVVCEHFRRPHLATA